MPRAAFTDGDLYRGIDNSKGLTVGLLVPQSRGGHRKDGSVGGTIRTAHRTGSPFFP